jgi:hypothetical protein
MHTNGLLRCVCIGLGIAISGCKASDAPKIPLDASRATPGAVSEAPMTGLTAAAKAALDSGNILFREKAYGQALAQYSRSAEMAPSELAPLLGIMMVADVTGDSKLAQSTLPRIRKLDPSMADSSTITAHSKMIKAHPRVGGPPST